MVVDSILWFLVNNCCQKVSFLTLCRENYRPTILQTYFLNGLTSSVNGRPITNNRPISQKSLTVSIQRDGEGDLADLLCFWPLHGF